VHICIITSIILGYRGHETFGSIMTFSITKIESAYGLDSLSPIFACKLETNVRFCRVWPMLPVPSRSCTSQIRRFCLSIDPSIHRTANTRRSNSTGHIRVMFNLIEALNRIIWKREGAIYRLSMGSQTRFRIRISRYFASIAEWLSQSPSLWSPHIFLIK
jgi:hypothetical protein